MDKRLVHIGHDDIHAMPINTARQQDGSWLRAIAECTPIDTSQPSRRNSTYATSSSGIIEL